MELWRGIKGRVRGKGGLGVRVRVRARVSVVLLPHRRHVMREGGLQEVVLQVDTRPVDMRRVDELGLVDQLHLLS